MTARRDPDRLIRAFLEDGPTELPDRSYDALRAQIDHTRQRVVVFGPWRHPRMSTLARNVIAVAAALVVAAVVGFNLIPRQSQFGGPGVSPTPGATASPSPTPSPTASPAARLPASGAVAAGTYYIAGASTSGLRFTFTMPAGWTTEEEFLDKDKGGPGGVMLVTWVVTHIFPDACRWDEEAVVDVGTTVDELVSALADQRGREASAPTDVTLGGFRAKRIELTVPADLDVAACTNGNLRYWPGPAPDFEGSRPDFSSGLCCNPPGNTDVVYAVDVAGSRLVVVARHYPGSSAENRAELQAIVDSIQIEP